MKGKVWRGGNVHLHRMSWRKWLGQHAGYVADPNSRISRFDNSDRSLCGACAVEPFKFQVPRQHFTT